jgi:hypothetical protein
MKANASGTPAKYASTPEALWVTRCKRPPGFAVTTAAASQVPKTAPTADVQTDRITLFLKAVLYDWESHVSLKLAHVSWLLSVVTDP